jgi:hypothetical protein
MSKQGELLHELIQSMNGAEKGHFVKFAQSRNTSDTDNRHLILFKELSAMPVYDEKLLNTRLRELGFPEQVHRIRNYLYNFILRFLDYSNDLVGINKVLTLTKYAFLLSERGLYDQALKISLKAKKLAQTYAIDGLEYELILLQRRVKIRGLELKDSRLLQRQLIESATQMKTTAELLQASSRIYEVYVGHGYPRSDEEQRTYETIYSEAVDGVSDDGLSGRGLIAYQNVSFMYNYVIGNDDESISWQSKRLETVTNYIEVDDNVETAKVAHNTLILRLLDLNRVDEATERQNEFKGTMNKLPKKFMSLEVEREMSLCDLYIAVKAYPMYSDESSLRFHLKNIAFDSQSLRSGAYVLYATFTSIGHIYLQEEKTALRYLIQLRDEKRFSNYVTRNDHNLAVLMIICYARMEKVDALSNLLERLKRLSVNRALAVDMGALKLLIENADYALNSSSGDFRKTLKERTLHSLKLFTKNQNNDLKRSNIDLPWYFKNVF